MGRTADLHPQFPEVVRMIVEQTRDARYRMRYSSERAIFYSTPIRSMLFQKRFPGVYGWVDGLGTPPGSHCDIFLVTKKVLTVGEIVDAYVCGVFLRSDLDHKILAVDKAHSLLMSTCDLSSLPDHILCALYRMYPSAHAEGQWAGADKALTLLEAMRLREFIPNADTE